MEQKEETQLERDLRIARRNIIFKGVMGSYAFGLEHDDSDHDYTCIFIEPPGNVFGPELPLATTAWRSVKKKARAEAGSVEETYYSLRRIVELLLQGNPRIFPILYTQNIHLGASSLGTELQMMHRFFMSERVAQAYLRSAESMTKDLKDPTKSKHQRPEAVKRFGYDAKFAMHTVRHCIQGIDLILNGELKLPMNEVEIRRLHAIRVGETELAQVVEQLELVLLPTLTKVASYCKLLPDTITIRRYLARAHLMFWENNGLV
jgi:predicted nucleotidyltransferase